ncbi:MAG: hypothetical protein QM820_44030 [Minicystis sp.]
MERALTFDDVRRALLGRDSDLADLVVALAQQPDAPPAAPAREGAPTFAGFAAEVKSPAFARKTPEERAHRRVEGIKALEAPGAEGALPDRARLHEIMIELWKADGAFERDALIRILERVPLAWGAWRGIKRIFKEAEARGDWEVIGAIAARLDAAFASGQTYFGEISKKTIAYLARRAWRSLRRQAEQLPAAYPDAAALVLSFYDDATFWQRTWIANHIFFHDAKKHTRRRFKFDRRAPQSLTQYRAYGDLWRRSPRPLFTLLTRARSEQARAFAVAALKADFRASLREVEPAWVARLIAVKSATAHEFVVWVLGNVPRFEQGAFRDLGLHAPVLTLFDSPSGDARAYAAAYARTHARDLPLDDLVRLANNDNEEVRKLARDLLHDRDPRKDVGLDGWGRLLGTPHAHELAAAALRKHFGARELSPEWFRERLLSDNRQVFDLAADLLGKLHAPKTLGAAYFRELLDDPRLTAQAARFALDALSRFTVADIGVDALRRALIHPLTRATLTAWIAEERVPAKDLGADFLKALAFEPTWEANPWVTDLKKSGRPWARDLAYSEPLSELSLKLLGDVRRFSPGDLGFEWLMRLAARSEKRFVDFAGEYMVKAFVPADFAPKEAAAEAPAAAAPAQPAQVDLKGQSFLFTGKLATMKRDDAEKKVSSANGKNAGAVNAKLDYLVIGDDGSPLYGAGRKGSKQLAAEKLVGQGAAIRDHLRDGLPADARGRAAHVLRRQDHRGLRDALAHGHRARRRRRAAAPARAALPAAAPQRYQPGAHRSAGGSGRGDPGGLPELRSGEGGARRSAGGDPGLRAGAGPVGAFPVEAAHRGDRGARGVAARGRARVRDEGAPGRRRQGARALPDRSEDAHGRRGLPLLRVARRGDAGAGDEADRPRSGARGAGGAVPAFGEPGPAGTRLRDPDDLVALPRSRDHDALEAGAAAGDDGRAEGRREEGGRGTEDRRPAGTAREAAGEGRRAGRVPPAGAVHGAAGPAAQGQRRAGGAAAGRGQGREEAAADAGPQGEDGAGRDAA